jgi:hypothetical protein
MTGGTHTSAGTEQAPELRLEWRSGAPTKPWSEEWFIAETIWGDRVVLRALPEEWTYDFKTADDTYIKHDKIKRWMPFPDSEFIAPDVPVVAQSVGRPGRLQLIAEADGVLSVGNAMDMSISGAWAFVQKARDFLAAQPPAAPVDQERLAELQNEAGMYKSLYENAIAQRSSAGINDAVNGLGWMETSVDRGDGSREFSGFEAETPFGTFYVIEIHGDAFTVEYDLTVIGEAGTPDEAKRIGQRDFEQRIRMALRPGLPQTVPVAEKPRPSDCPWPVDCMWRHVPTSPEIGLYLCSRFGCPHTTSAGSAHSRPKLDAGAGPHPSHHQAQEE